MDVVRTISADSSSLFTLSVGDGGILGQRAFEHLQDKIWTLWLHATYCRCPNVRGAHALFAATNRALQPFY